MNANQHIPTLQATAAVLLPGMRHARSVLDVSIRGLEYFEGQAAKDAANGKAVTLRRMEPALKRQVENSEAMLRVFGRLHAEVD
jgi:hypothetical protein